MAKRKKQEQEGGAGWLTTYADLMTLLLCFFVLLYAMSSPDEAKYQMIVNSLQEALIGQNGATIFDQPSMDEEELVGDPIPEEGLPAESDEIINEVEGEDEDLTGDLTITDIASEVYGAVSDYLETQGLESTVNVEIVEEGILLDIKEQVLFDLGQATIKTDSLQTLNKLGVLFNKFENQIRVTGHTDNVPISTNKYPSNWELAAARSCAIVRYYTDNQLDSKRFTCTSKGETEPIATNDTEAGRAKNRRVNFLIEATPQELVNLTEVLKKETIK